VTDSFKQFIEDLNKNTDWLRAMGLRVDATRFGQYERLYKSLRETELESSREFSLAMAGLESGQELSAIRQWLAHVPPDVLKQRLETYISGPELEGQEKAAASSNRARNTGVELVFGARLSSVGYPPNFPEIGDLEIRSDCNVNIECKRPQSVSNLRKLIKDASDQLTKRATEDENTANVIVLSIGKIVHGGTHIVRLPTRDSVQPFLNREATNFVQENDHIWQSREGINAHAVVVQLSTIVHVESTNYWLWAEQEVINPVKDRKTHKGMDAMKRVAHAFEERGRYLKIDSPMYTHPDKPRRVDE
jgi:hypothetical protein